MEKKEKGEKSRRVWLEGIWTNNRKITRRFMKRQQTKYPPSRILLKSCMVDFGTEVN